MDRMSLTIMSCRQKSLIVALYQHFSYAKIRFCGGHVYANLKKKFSIETLREKLRKAVRATNKIDFDIVIDAIKRKDEATHKWLMDSGLSHAVVMHLTIGSSLIM